MTYGIALVSILLGAFGQFLMKLGADHLQTTGGIRATLWGLVTSRELLLGLVFFGSSFLLWIYVLRKMALSVAYPMVSLSYVVVTLLAVVYLHEQWSAAKLISLALIIAGVVLLNLSSLQR